MKLTIIHTTKATIEPLEALVRELLPQTQLTHMLDDSMLRDMVSGHDTQAVRKRWITYAKIAQSCGADVVLSACSTVGEFAEEANVQLHIPVLRIDSAMADEAVAAGSAITVLATLPSTLEPTKRLIARRAEQSGRPCRLNATVVDGAYDALMAGHPDLHDKMIAAAIKKALAVSDVVVLAQASMARAASGFTPGALSRILTSPRSGIEQIKEFVL